MKGLVSGTNEWGVPVCNAFTSLIEEIKTKLNSLTKTTSELNKIQVQSLMAWVADKLMKFQQLHQSEILLKNGDDKTNPVNVGGSDGSISSRISDITDDNEISTIRIPRKRPNGKDKATRAQPQRPHGNGRVVDPIMRSKVNPFFAERGAGPVYLPIVADGVPNCQRPSVDKSTLKCFGCLKVGDHWAGQCDVILKAIHENDIGLLPASNLAFVERIHGRKLDIETLRKFVDPKSLKRFKPHKSKPSYGKRPFTDDEFERAESARANALKKFKARKKDSASVASSAYFDPRDDGDEDTSSGSEDSDDPRKM